jgi:hypothetical protein
MMNFLKQTAVCILFLLPFCAKAQNCNYNYLGTKTLYTSPQKKTTPAPADYKPVFINHVGRHGARHLTKEVNTGYAYQFLMHADSAGGLTAQGRQLKQMVMALDQTERGQVKSISAEGRAELAGIGKRMFSNYPQVFLGMPKLNVAFTKEVRTKQSAEAFLVGLKQGFQDSAVIKERTDDVHLRFYDASPIYKAFEANGNWTTAMQTLQRKLDIAAINKQIGERWLSPPLIKTLDPDKLDKLVNDVFGLAAIVPSLKAEIKKAGFSQADTDIASLFTCAELTALSKIDVADDYLKKGPGTNNNGIQVRIAIPLLVDFINTTDNFVKSPTVNAELRFAHAETIAPFAALLGITIANKVATDITKLDASWKSSEVAPLSANLQWVFYSKKGNGELLVKVLLNEQEVHIDGLATGLFPYYEWRSMRAFYMDKLNKLNVRLDDNMDKYLTTIK